MTGPRGTAHDTATSDRGPVATVRRLAGPLPPRRLSPARAVAVVWRVELAKLVRLVRVQALAGVCLVAPFLAAAAVSAQSSLPQDTLFGQWLQQSGLALPLVVLGFAGQWLLPLLTCLVAGDIFASEDQFGTWKTVLTRSRSRGELFTGKVLAALSYPVIVLALLAGSTVVAGLLLGREPVVGLGGQVVPVGHAAALVAASWSLQLPPMFGFCLLAVLLSVITRNGVAGVGGPVLLGLLMQLLALLSLPPGVQDALLTTPFSAWHGLWVEHPFYGPAWRGLLTSGVWSAVCLATAWAVFRRRQVRVS